MPRFNTFACLPLWDKSQVVHLLTWQYDSIISSDIAAYLALCLSHIFRYRGVSLTFLFCHNTLSKDQTQLILRLISIDFTRALEIYFKTHNHIIKLRNPTVSLVFWRYLKFCECLICDFIFTNGPSLWLTWANPIARYACFHII